MDKLIELLNEYNKEKTNGEIGWREREYDNEFGNLLYGRYNGGTFSTLYCISKEYGFIKWLVDNDKIDQFYYENSVRVKRYIDEYEEYDYVFPEIYKQLIMILSIQDNPIEFLISILKDKKVRTVYVDEDGNVSGDTKRYSDC